MREGLPAQEHPGQERRSALEGRGRERARDGAGLRCESVRTDPER